MSSLRALPAVETVLRHPSLEPALAAMPRALVVESVRAELAAERARLRAKAATPATIDTLAARAGERLVEVGTTNRTHRRDYERALARHPDAAALLRVHPSNFRIEGFTARPALDELVRLAHRARLPLVEDLGSGALLDLEPLGLPP